MIIVKMGAGLRNRNATAFITDVNFGLLEVDAT